MSGSARKPAVGKRAAGGIDVTVVQLAHGEGLPLPVYQTPGAAGLDLVAAVADDKPIKLKRKARALIPTGLAIALPAGFEAQVRPRSGLAVKHGVTVLNSPGTIDCDYRGEVQVLLVNLGDEAFTVRRGERIAQLVIAPVSRAELRLAAALDGTARGSGGFGSTGTTAKRTAGGTRAGRGQKSKALPKPGKSGKRRG